MLRKRLCVVPYKRYSEGARILARKLGVHRMPDPDLIRGGLHVINWGNSQWEVPPAVKVFNRPERVKIAVDKFLTYQAFQAAGVPTVPFTTDRAVAATWKGPIICRTLLKASEGKGIVVAESPVDLVPAKVYTSYVKKKREYRVHIFNGKVIGYKRKVKLDGAEVKDFYIRSHANGYRYIIDKDHPPSQSILDTAVAACGALRLDFGGVDVIWREKDDKAFALEVNCAPGLTDMTGDWYADAFRGVYK